MQEKREVYSDYGIPIFYDNRNGEMILRDTKEFFEGEQAASYDVWKDQLLKIRGRSIKKSHSCVVIANSLFILVDVSILNPDKRNFIFSILKQVKKIFAFL